MILRFVIIFFSFCNLFLLIRPINNFEEEIDVGQFGFGLRSCLHGGRK